jgi:recombination protein RecA
VVKNKMAPPFRQVEFDIMYGEGISRTGDLLDLAVENKIVDKSGAWYSFQGERVGQGRENAKLFLAEHDDMATQIRELVLTHFGLGKATLPEIEGDAASDEGAPDAAADAEA